jgi:predicted deacetylase
MRWSRLLLPTTCFSLLALLLTGRAGEIQWRPEATWKSGRNPVVKMMERAAENERLGRYRKAAKGYRKIEKKSVNMHNKALAVLSRGRCLQRDHRPWPA